MWLLGLLVGLIVGCAVARIVCDREMQRISRFLHERPADSNARLAVALPGKANHTLILAINEQLDAIQAERMETMRRTQEFQRDLSALAHDVRTPLMGAQGHIQLALDEDAKEEAADAQSQSERDERERHLRVALTRLDDMRGLLDQLFAYARANDPDRTLTIEPIAVQPLVAEVLVGHYPEFEERDWQPRVIFDDERFTLQADATALRRIVDNLVTNALRHGSGAPTIRQHDNVIEFANPISASAAADIDPNQLFDRFYQADHARSSKGSGLGLAVAQSLAQAMRLRLTAKLQCGAALADSNDDSASSNATSLIITIMPA